ncbi:hypothetical protein PR202_gb09311 [Eleusine coracana subsp. coracana]|uniref:Inhibitor I9 domain-containing protein n=1 Tax=Eleusine coracana subsp. coracana TaxID=191504 RepID=A0AAV5EH83_ELECO|nr:hypothetical protein PR202_gb09311 [Eleusine coracana subsp. coracana]
MTPQLLLSLLTILGSSHVTASIRRPSDNATPISAYIVSVRRPDGLLGLGADEPDALERWHTHLLSQVCNTSDPATSARFPTAESRLIYSYSHVVSGFSAWLTPREVERLPMFPWFVEAVPDKSYKLMSVDEPPATQLSGGIYQMPDSDGVIIGVLADGAGRDPGRVLFSREGDEGVTPPPPAKWKGRCDHSGGCNNGIIGMRSFVDDTRRSSPQGTDMSGGASGINYTAAFAVAPRAHLAIYQVCNEREKCDPKAVSAGLDAAVDDGVDVVTLLIRNEGDDNAAFHDGDDAVTVPSYKAVARGVVVCAPAGSSGPEMYRVESTEPWRPATRTAASSPTWRSATGSSSLTSARPVW